MSTKDELKQERLLKEYEVSFQYASHHASIIWQTASIFLSVSLAGLAYFSMSRPDNLISLISRVAIYAGAVTLIEGWFYLFRRWNGFLHKGYYRMKEIEGILKDMFLIQYGDALRQPRLKPFKKARDIKEGNLNTPSSFAEIEGYKDFPSARQQDVVRLLCVLLDLGWGILLVSDILSIVIP